MDSDATAGHFEAVADQVVLLAEHGCRIAIEQGNVLRLGRGEHVVAGGKVALFHLFLEQRAAQGVEENEMAITFKGPRMGMASFLAESKWGRCAAMKAGAQSNEKLYGWFWNPAVHFALAPGVSCYRANMEYAHGGISLKECLTLQLTVQSRVGASSLFDVRISNVRWVQQRCHVSLQGITDGLLIDIREAPSKPDTSLLVGPPKQVSDPEPSFVVDDSHNGKAALVVLVDANGNVVTQVKTVVGGGLYGNA